MQAVGILKGGKLEAYAEPVEQGNLRSVKETKNAVDSMVKRPGGRNEVRSFQETAVG